MDILYNANLLNVITCILWFLVKYGWRNGFLWFKYLFSSPVHLTTANVIFSSFYSAILFTVKFLINSARNNKTCLFTHPCKKQNSIVEREFSKKFPQKSNRCPNRRTEVISEQTSNLPFLRVLERQSKGKFPSFCLRRRRSGETVVPIVEEGRPKNTSWFELSNCTKDAFEKARKGREFDTAKLLPGSRGSNPFSPERAKGRPCWVASAIFGHTRTKKAG